MSARSRADRAASQAMPAMARSPARRTVVRWLKGLASFSVVVLIWWLVTDGMHLFTPLVLPSPLTVAKSAPCPPLNLYSDFSVHKEVFSEGHVPGVDLRIVDHRPISILHPLIRSEVAMYFHAGIERRGAGGIWLSVK